MSRLVGRDRELQLLAEGITRARSGTGSLILVEGEAGAGKSALLEEAAQLAGDFSVFVGAGHSIDHDRPFGLIGDALGIHAAAEDRARAAIADALRRGPVPSGAGLMYRIADDLAELVERESTRRPVLLVLDDLQWADEPTLLTVHRIARSFDHLPVAVVAACRPLPRPAGLEDLDRLVDEKGVRLPLGPLEESSVNALARRRVGADPGPRLARLLAWAGGNPFFVTELVAALEDEGSIRIEAGAAETESAAAPRELSIVILRRLGALSRETIRILQAASILGTSFAARDLALVLDTAPRQLAVSLEEPMRAGVIVDAGERLRFRHDLVREALYGDLSGSIRAAMHHEFALRLAGAGARADQVAAHFVAAAPFGDEVAIEWLRRAAREAADSSPSAACSWLSEVLTLLPPGDARRDEIIQDIAPLLIDTGRIDAAGELASEALRRPQPPARRGRLTRLVAWAQDAAGRCLDAASTLEAEVAAPDQTELERVRMAAKMLEYRAHMEPVEAGARARDLLPAADKLDDHLALSEIYETLRMAASWRGECGAALDFARRADDQSRLAGGAGAPHHVARALLDAGLADDAAAILQEDLRACEAQGKVRRLPRGLYLAATADWLAGRWDAATAQSEAAAQLFEEFAPGVEMLSEILGLLAMMEARRGRSDRASALLGGRPAVTSNWMWAWSEATLHRVSGDESGALDTLRGAWGRASRTGHEAELLGYGPDLVRLEAQAGAAGRARALAEAMRTLALRGGVEWVEAASLLCSGLADGDSETLVEAARRLESTGPRILFAAAAEDAGLALGRAGRKDEAARLLQQAVSCHEESGALWDVRRVESALRALGVRRGKRGALARPATGWESLTEIEKRVAELAAEGRTNAEAGARLFISGRTVERHLTHVYAKLGISSRVELAALAARASGRT